MVMFKQNFECVLFGILRHKTNKFIFVEPNENSMVLFVFFLHK